ncbi:tetratricopeptide repeat protein [Fibrella forsythiae]|uniref:Tetratricopeptide repeat protein n=1 Tax=Fibrella forsythiae TaxID=2817061 RepID=A0ABS3JLB1_9BACT|nr:tetratricopeptide repeat protein [Fibrella forsythiae]MBO0950800.1 tetratricopeptide repeat protein [Fibrella forsythiae]
MSNDQLDDHIYAEIVKLCEKGDNYVEVDDYKEAINCYQQAFKLVPQPYQEWEASTWILFSLGEAYFFNQEFDKAQQALQDVMHCPNAIGNPLIHLRLGQVQFELGNFVKAKDELMRAYMGEGEEIFDGEDKKYFNYLKKEVQL